MLNIFKRVVISLIPLMLLSACGSSKNSPKASTANDFLNAEWIKNHFMGLLVIDPITKDTLQSINAQKYFTPASTTKIFTLYTAQKLLPERIPTLKYLSQNDTLYFEGAGDPTQLHSYFQDSTAIHFLNEHDNLVWNPKNYIGSLIGPGWAWEDYEYYYQVERGALPLYGNVVNIHRTDSLEVLPEFFKQNIIDLDYSLNREIESNTFYYGALRRDTIEIPYRSSSELTKKLLQSVLNKPIFTTTTLPESEKSILYSVPSDSVYKRMMHESDNFLADQLLILSSSMLSDTLDGKKVREYILKNELSNLKQPPRWVDGSGLSRYNLFTPESMVQVLLKLKQEVTQERLFNVFPSWEIATSKSEMKTPKKNPYIFAKSGSLGNNYSLNGYILTKSGKILIFSFMNNHFMSSSKIVKEQIQQFLQQLYNAY